MTGTDNKNEGRTKHLTMGDKQVKSAAMGGAPAAGGQITLATGNRLSC
jgi:hypothetical protein